MISVNPQTDATITDILLMGKQDSSRYFAQSHLVSVKAIVWVGVMWLHTMNTIHMTIVILPLKRKLRPTEIESYNWPGAVLTVILWYGLFIFHIFKHLANYKSQLGESLLIYQLIFSICFISLDVGYSHNFG